MASQEPVQRVNETAEVIPILLENRNSGEAVRVWSAGCATGEEAYTIGMLLSEVSSRP